MRILYGVTGEGMGHAMRSRVVLEHLLAQGHEIEIVSSNRAADYLSDRFGGTTRIHGLHMVLDENRIQRGKTLWSNILEGTTGVPKNIAAYFEMIERFVPEVVISDFESWSYLYGQNNRIPIISIDNMQIINRCTHPDEIIEGEKTNFRFTKAFVKSKLPFCEHYLITTFFHPEIRKKNTSLHPPILRSEILAAQASDGEHLLVYQTAVGNDSLEEVLANTGIECRIYGMRKGLTEEEVDGNLRHRPFSEEGFIEDLVTTRAVIAGSGFTLMGEAVYLRKPMLAIPLKGQFEQVMNARYLAYEGYGQHAEDLEDEGVLHSFLEEIPRYREKLASYSQDGNSDLLGALDHQLDRAAAGLL
ncbi:MAG: teichoic acid biosynthesis protein [Myxococcales bacterium]|nr:teichoic acid biosynthesis protein [Myxococcales bacterium]